MSAAPLQPGELSSLRFTAQSCAGRFQGGKGIFYALVGSSMGNPGAKGTHGSSGLGGVPAKYKMPALLQCIYFYFETPLTFLINWILKFILMEIQTAAGSMF